ncbi:MAG: type II toxin-antitoxin system PemK/MazF family toxin [Thermoanaerobaculales bacterium]|nr:type II toxin-antitoxin system PemK/MazF family toxin [Thermoanaerobaculales bacterium]
MSSDNPRRGDIWLASLDPIRGHEQAGTRPILIISHDDFNGGPADLCIVIPITSRLHPIPSHIRIVPPEGGLQVESAALCEAVRSISKERLIRRLGKITAPTLATIEDVLRILLVL